MSVSVAFIDTNRYRWPVLVMCRVLGVSERTYYAAKCRPPSARAVADDTARGEIRRVWEANYRAYGAKRVWLTLRREGYPMARCTVERLMADMGIAGVRRGHTPRTTMADPTAVRAPDLVDRQFRADRPDQLWVTDAKCRRRHLMSPHQATSGRRGVEVPPELILRGGRSPVDDRGANLAAPRFAFPAVGAHDPSDPLAPDPEALPAQPTMHPRRPVGTV